jgi:predicted dehydrogenase
LTSLRCGIGLKVAVVGLGFGRIFARMLKDHPDCELACVADLNEQMVVETARELQVERTARTLDELLAMQDVEAVGIFTHAPRHAEHSIAALQAGKHVLCAVPAAIALEECQELVHTVRQTGLVYASAETSYWRPPTAQCRQWYQDGRFGRVVYMEAEYLHDAVHGHRTSSPPEYGGKDWRAAGFPPLLYITHSTGHALGVTGGRLTEVSAYASPVPNDDVYRADTYWKCPFANAVGLFRQHDGVPVRIMEMRRVAFGEAEKFSIYGQNLSFVSPHQQRWESSHQVVERGPDGKLTGAAPWYRRGLYASLPDPLVKYTYGGHAGSHPYIVEDWVRSVLDGRIPEVNVYEAVAYCSPGIVAHESCLRDGERLRIPQFGKLKRDDAGSYTAMIDDAVYQHH